MARRYKRRASLRRVRYKKGRRSLKRSYRRSVRRSKCRGLKCKPCKRTKGCTWTRGKRKYCRKSTARRHRTIKHPRGYYKRS